MTSVFFRGGGILLAVLMLSLPSRAAAVVINEFQASNGITIADEDGDYPDWIELFNPGDEPVNLAGFGLSDREEEPFRWVFPDVVVEPEGFLLVFASGKDRREGPVLHTNFAIAATGEELLLSAPDGGLLDFVLPTPVARDYSFGRRPDGGEGWFFFCVPTPGTPNITKGLDELLTAPSPSHDGGWHRAPFLLTWSSDHGGAEILYTLDGSEPDPANLGEEGTPYLVNYFFPEEWETSQNLPRVNQSHLYESPIWIDDRSDEPNDIADIITTYWQAPNIMWLRPDPVAKGTVVRARAVKDGCLGPVATHTYLVHPDGENRHTLPVVAIAADPRQLFGYEDGLNVPGIEYFEGGGTEDWYGTNWRRPNNFFREGREWEVPVGFEYYPLDGSRFAQHLGLRLHGGSSLIFPFKGIRLYARSSYDDEEVVDHPLMTSLVEGESATPDRHTRFLLRPGGNTDDHLRDVVAHRIFAPMAMDVQRSSPVVKYVNGEYWGITYLRDRQDRYFVAHTYGVHPDDVVMLNAPWGQGWEEQVQEGVPEDIELYRELFNYVVDHDMNDPVHYAHVLDRMDVAGYMDYNIAFIYTVNFDWFGNKHFRYWRTREIADAPYYDGTWRFMIWDFDYAGMDRWSHWDMLALAIHPLGGGDLRYTFGNDPTRTVLLRNLLDSDRFRSDFINRFADHLNTTFAPERVKAIAQASYEELAAELPEHEERWGRPATRMATVNSWLAFADDRPFHLRSHIRNHFDLADEFELTVDVNDPAMGVVRVNSIVLSEESPGISGSPYPWTGTYFTGVPVEVEAIPAPGFQFMGWEGIDEGFLDPVVTVEESSSLTAHFAGAHAPGGHLVHFWVFDNSLPNDTPLEFIPAGHSLPGDATIEFHSALQGYPFEPGHPKWRKASMERRNAPTPVNYRPEGNHGLLYGEFAMRGMQVRQPFTGDGGHNTLVLHLPTAGYRDIVLRFAAKDEGAAEALVIDYSIAAGEPAWQTAGLPASVRPLDEEYTLFSVDFSEIAAANDNPEFRVRIRFSGPAMAADHGDRVTFNNVSLEGVPLSVPEFDLTLATSTDPVPPGDPLSFTATLANVGGAAAGFTAVLLDHGGRLAWISDTPSHGAFDSETGRWTLPGLAAGDTATLTLTAHAEAVRGEITVVADLQAPWSGRATATARIGDTAPIHYVGIASAAGLAGTQWRSSGVLFNPGAIPEEVQLEVIPRGQALPVTVATRWIAPGVTEFHPDLYDTLGAPGGVGALRLTGEVLAWVRTFNRDQVDDTVIHTFGQDVPAVERGTAVAAEQTVLFPLFVPVNVDAGYRSNLLLLNLEDRPLVFTMRSGSITRQRAVPARTYLQFTDVGTTVLGQVPGIHTLKVSADGAWFGTLSVVDPGTGDPTTIQPAHPPDQEVEKLFIGVASMPGFAGTQWRSDLVLFNPGEDEAAVHLAITVRGQSVPAIQKTLVLAPGETHYLPDLYQAMDASPGAGTLSVAGPVAAWVRTFNQGSQGTFGQDVPGVDPQAGVPAGEPLFFPIHAPEEVETGFRSNLLIQNLEHHRITVTVSAGEHSLHREVRGGVYVQISNLAEALGLPPGVHTVRIEADGRWAGTVSTIDPYTGDPTTVRGMAVQPGNNR